MKPCCPSGAMGEHCVVLLPEAGYEPILEGLFEVRHNVTKKLKLSLIDNDLYGYESPLRPLQAVPMSHSGTVKDPDNTIAN